MDFSAILHSASRIDGDTFEPHGLESEDAYFFIRKFEEACLMMRILQLGDDSIRLCFILFALKDLEKSGIQFSG